MFTPFLFSDLMDSFLFFRDTTFLAGLSTQKIDNSYVIEYELPGFTKEDISLKLDGNILNINAKTKKKDKSIKFSLSSSVNKDLISSKLENGILYITIPLVENLTRGIPVD